MKYLFRLIKIFIVSLLTIFIVSVTAAYLLLNIPSVQQKITRWGEDELSSLLGTRHDSRIVAEQQTSDNRHQHDRKEIRPASI